MTRTIVISGWELGFQKVKFTELLRYALGYSLSEAKARTDAVLNNHQVEIDFEESKSSELLAKVRALGAKCILKP